MFLAGKNITYNLQFINFLTASHFNTKHIEMCVFKKSCDNNFNNLCFFILKIHVVELTTCHIFQVCSWNETKTYLQFLNEISQIRSVA